LHFTRYNRAIKMRWPFSLYFGESISARSIPFKRFNARGYVTVSCDVRGTGVSFGNRKYDFHHEEVEDFREVMDWIIKQKFSDGRIVSTGISYDGMATDFMASLNHKALVAVSTVSSPFDLYRDLVYPGGIYQSSFVDPYLAFTKSLEQGVQPEHACDGCEPETFSQHFKALLAKLAVGGVYHVNGDDQSATRAFEEHKQSPSFNLSENVKHFEKGIDVVVNITESIMYDTEKDGQTRVIKEITKRIPMLILGGYYESVVQNSAIKRFYSLSHEKSKLILGPYSHGFRAFASPYAKEETPCFVVMDEVMRFFDHHLEIDQEEDSGLYDEPKVHYFTTGLGWRSANEWPPKGSTVNKLFLSNSGKLTLDEPSNVSPQTVTLDLNTKTTIHSKWNMVSHLFGKLPRYTELLSNKEWNQGKLNFISEPLQSHTEISGDIQLNLTVSANNKDGTIFAYLQEVSRDGKVHLIMDAQLRFSHRKLVTDLGNGITVSVPQYSSKMQDLKPIEPEQQEQVTIFFPSVSYQVKKGNQIKLSLFAFDASNFKVWSAEQLATEVTIHGGSVLLPTFTSSQRHQPSKDEL